MKLLWIRLRETSLGEGCRDSLLGKTSRSVGLGLEDEAVGSLLLVVERSGADLSLSLELSNHSSVLPAHLLGKTSENGEFAVRLETKDSQSLRDDDSLDLVVGVGNSLDDLDSAEGVSTTDGLVWEHASDRSPENLRGSAEMEGAASGVDVASLVQESEVAELVAVERSGNVNFIGPDGNNSLSLEELLGDD